MSAAHDRRAAAVNRLAHEVNAPVAAVHYQNPAKEDAWVRAPVLQLSPSSVGGLLGTGVLLWPLYNSVYPVPAFPNNRWPYLVATWLVVGAFLPSLIPAVAAFDKAER